MWDGGVAIANGEIGSGIIEKVTFEQRLGMKVLCIFLGQVYCGWKEQRMQKP